MSNFFLDSVKKDTSLTSLNESNDLTRLAYSNKSADIPLRNNFQAFIQSQANVNKMFEIKKLNEVAIPPIGGVFVFENLLNEDCFFLKINKFLNLKTK